MPQVQVTQDPVAVFAIVGLMAAVAIVAFVIAFRVRVPEVPADEPARPADEPARPAEQPVQPVAPPPTFTSVDPVAPTPPMQPSPPAQPWSTSPSQDN